MIIPPSGIADVAAVAAHYDDLDELYRSIWGSNIHHGYWISGSESSEEAISNLTQLVAREASIEPGDRVCDMGCGYGAVALILNREYGAEVTGLTVSEKQFHQAKSAAAANDRVKFLLRDALRNNLAAASFDVAIAVESSEHMPDKLDFFREFHRFCAMAGDAWSPPGLPASGQDHGSQSISSKRSAPKGACQTWHHRRNFAACWRARALAL